MKASWRIHPDLACLDDILGPTYGCLIYQESAMEALAAVCGWDYARADLILSAMRKKDLAKLDLAKPHFMEDGLAHGTSQAGLNALWDILIPFGSYGFNKSHSYGYSYISYYSAYLKANYPKQYMTSLLASAKSEDRERYLAETRRMGITLLPPDINDSGANFTQSKEGIRYGLSHIKGLGAPSAEAIVAQRRYASLDDFLRRADPKALNARTLDALIRCGVFDSLWGDRESLLAEAGRLVGLATRHREAERTGQRPLFTPRYTPRQEGGQAEEAGGGRTATRRQWELELLGAELSYSTIILEASRPLEAQEWTWLRQLLSNAAPVQPVEFHLGGLRMDLPKTTYSDRLARQLATVGIRSVDS